MRAKVLVNFLENLIFKVLLLLLPSQLALHLWPNWSYIFGIRIDYLAPSIYLTDILIVLLIFLSLINKAYFQSRKFSIKNKLLSNSKYFTFALLLFFYSIINIYLADVFQVTLIKWLKVFELIFIAFYVGKNKLDVSDYKIIGYSVIYISIIAILQFCFQSSLGGPLYFLGERSFTSETPGIALSQIFGRSVLRPYSIFSHPNSMAGFLFVSCLVLLSVYKKLGKKFLISVVSFSLAGILVSFSLGVYLSVFIIGNLFAVYLFNKKLYKKLLYGLFWFLIVLSITSPVIVNEFQFSYIEAISKFSRRIGLIKATSEIIAKSNFLFGVGLNNFVIQLPTTNVHRSIAWLLQPVHNIFLLLLVEGGLIGLILLSIAFWKLLIKIFNNKDKILLSLPLIGVVMTGVVDHYWMTLQQNQLLISFVFGVLIKSVYEKK